MPTMKINIGTHDSPNWVVMDAKNAETLGGKSVSTIESNAKDYTDTQLENFSPKIEAYKHELVATLENQKSFPLSDIFDPSTDTIIDVTQNGMGLGAKDYTLDDDLLYLTQEVDKGTVIAFTILKNVPLKEQQSKLIAGDLMAGYYGKESGLITGNELFTKTGLTAGTTVVSGDITWLKFSHNYKTLYVADRGLKNEISWDDIQAQDLVKGKVVEIEGKQYLCRLLNSSVTNPSTKSDGEFFDLISTFTPNNSDSHWDKNVIEGGYTWVQQISALDITDRVFVGGSNITYTYTSSSVNSGVEYAYRPVLELL